MRSLVTKKLFSYFACAALAVFAATASAVGMGRLHVLSSLGQQLHVEIELIAVDKEERGSLSAKLGSARSYERSSLPIGAAGNSGIRVSVEQRVNGGAYIRVTSAKPIYEPFVNLVIELTSPSGPVTREFAVLLDPPEITPARSTEAEPRPPAAVAETKTPAPAPAPPAADSEYGPVRRGETLSRIASKVRPPNATVEQTMLGIFRNNPTAFINNNMNLLKAGHRLRIPVADQIAALSQTESAQALRTQTISWASNRPTPAAEDSASKPRTPPLAGKAAAPAKTGEKGKHVVKLSSGAPDGKALSIEDRVRMLEEDLAARERALVDANERIKKLEKATMGAPAAGERQK